MPALRRFDHVGVTVSDLDLVTDFFVALGLEVEGRSTVQGDFIDTVLGIPDSCSEIVMLRAPGGGAGIELARFVRPDSEPGSPEATVTRLGLRSVGFEVDDLTGLVERLSADGYALVGGIGEYEGVWQMAHVRGPEGIVVALAQRVG